MSNRNDRSTGHQWKTPSQGGGEQSCTNLGKRKDVSTKPKGTSGSSVVESWEMERSGQLFDASGDPIECSPNDVFLSYTIPAYKEAMYTKFRELEANGGDGKAAAREMLNWFKKGGGRFFRLIDRKKKQFEEVDHEAALASE